MTRTAEGAHRRPPRPFARGTVRAQTADEASAFDRRSIEALAVPQPVLTENAGRSAALVVDALYGALRPEGPKGTGGGHARGRPERRALALVGAGNNGGDALVAARSLRAWGWSVRVLLAADRPADDPLLHGWALELGDAGDADTLDRALAEADVVLDGILGTGVRGSPRERQARVIERLDAAGRPVVALDVPSGIDATTGAVPGAAVRADVTVAFGAPKLGALLHPARARVGRHVAVEIGFPPLGADDASSLVATPAWALERLPTRDTDTHKNRVGRVVVVGGGVGAASKRGGMAGAAILTARAAFRAGAGVVRVVSDPSNRDAVLAAVPEAIFLPWSVGDAADDGLGTPAREVIAEADAIAVGPGLGTDPAAASLVDAVLAAGNAPIVLDADALNLAAEGRVDLARAAGLRSVLLTPHPGEMARLVADAGGRPRPDVARAAADRFGCAVLLKGAPSLVAAPGAPLLVDTQSSSDLAVAGMGDTLTGACAALLAQGLDGHTAAAVGLYLTGRAARLADRGAGLTPSDVAERLPEALAEGPGPASLDLPFVLFDADPAD